MLSAKGQVGFTYNGSKVVALSGGLIIGIILRYHQSLQLGFSFPFHLLELSSLSNLTPIGNWRKSIIMALVIFEDFYPICGRQGGV